MTNSSVSPDFHSSNFAAPPVSSKDIYLKSYSEEICSESSFRLLK